MFEINLLNIVALIVTVLVMVWAYFTTLIFLRRREYKHIPGPDAKGILGFYFGLYDEIGKVYAEGKGMEDLFAKWTEQYGPVFRIQFGSDFGIFTTDRDAMREIMITKNYQVPLKKYKSFTRPYNIRWVGDGLNTEPDMQKWKHRRTIYNQQFQRNILLGFVNQFNFKGEALMERLGKYANDATPFCLYSIAKRGTVDIIAQVAFNLDFDSINNDSEDSFHSMLCEANAISMRHFSDPIAEINPMKLKDRSRFKKLAQFVRTKSYDIIMDRIKNADHHIKDILSSIIEACKQNENEADIELMIDDFLSFFAAGSDTTVHTICSVVKHLSEHSDVLEKVRKEIDDVLGLRTDITYDDFIKLKYVLSVIKESLRITPPFPVAMRYLEKEDLTICNYKIPHDSLIWLSTYVTSRMEKNFPNALEFKPERFMSDSEALETKVDRFAYFPFSLGPRNCVGQYFAQIEATVLLVKFFQRFNFKITESSLGKTANEAEYILSSVN